MTLLLKGNEAAVYGALAAGCQAFYGYPITPASEIAETAARVFPCVGALFLQAESETAAINMVYGAASAGQRVLTASSSPGVSLMQEGLSYAAGAELPIVLVDVTRGGPGLGNISPEQGDYRQIVKGGGHGCYRVPTLAPASPAEMFSFTQLAFELAERYRTPVCVLADGFVAQMMETVELDLAPPPPCARPWAVDGTAATRDNVITSFYFEPDELEAHVRSIERKLAEAAAREVRFVERAVDDADVLLVAYGIAGRVAEAALEEARSRGERVGLLRPQTLWPFPSARLRALAERVARVLVVELSTGQLVEDVALAVRGRVPVELCARVGGNVPSVDEVLAALGARRESA